MQLQIALTSHLENTTMHVLRSKPFAFSVFLLNSSVLYAAYVCCLTENR
jgi:hypothetical protein